MDRFIVARGRPSPVQVWVCFLRHIDAWTTLLTDTDWVAATSADGGFALFTASPDSSGASAWDAFADYCVSHGVVAVSSWGPDSSVVDDTFDTAAVMRTIEDRPTSEPLTTWHDDEPLESALGFFLSLAIDVTVPRVLLFVSESQWLTQAQGHLVRQSCS